uniref:Uncharacterized protein n=1 Tax=Brassica oleracea var. oleracea TaxID=109376 RepID=A0A0D3D4E4_BRAOL
MYGDFPTVILSPSFDTRYIFELDFQCHQFEVNQHHVAEVMPALLKSGQSTSREEAVEEMKDCRSMKHHWYRSIVIPENSPSLFRDQFRPKIEFPIPPDKGAHLSSYVEVLDDHQHVETSQRGLRYRDEVDKGPTETSSINTDRIPSNDTKKPVSIDTTTSPLIDTGRISEQKDFDVCGNLFDGETTTRSDKSGGKEEEKLEEEEKDQGRFSAIIDPSLLRWCQEIQSAQHMLLTSICKTSSTPYC